VISAMKCKTKIVVFDIGNVLLRWNPRNLYRKIFADEERMEWFLNNICTGRWNLEQDRGRSFAEGVRLLINEHPEWESEIRMFDERWLEMISGEVAENVAVLKLLQQARIPTYTITNSNPTKFVDLCTRFPFLNNFDGVVVSGNEQLLKPDPEIYRVLLERYGLNAGDCVFIDDSLANIETAQALDMSVVHFDDREPLTSLLEPLKLNF